jgi:tetratricopeptide (TPR) repeat protein
LLDELARNDVLYTEGESYRFSSAALRDAVLGGMDGVALERNHRRLGQAFAKLAARQNPSLMIEAGWHLIQGSDDIRGADLIAAVTYDAVTVRLLNANLHYCGEALEAALKVYRRHRRSTYERMPLLAALAQAGYYEERAWGERYGDEALDALEDISGLRTARRLRPFCGRWLSLVAGVLFAVFRFALVPRRERQYSFGQVLVQLMSTVTTLAGAASLSLDSERAERVAATLEPFSVLPDKLTPVGIYQFCQGLGEIGRDNEPAAYETFDKLLSRFQDPKYYPTLPADARQLYVAAAHFARASFAIFRADGRGALESADALDRIGLKLYSMIASQLRFLYYMNRGEFPKATVHRDRVELQAAQVGSVWQVETWQAAALILVHTTLNDVVGSTRVAHRLELLSRTVPSLKRHARLAQNGLLLSRHEKSYIEQVADDYKTQVPRSYIGWGATMAYLARGYNERGRHAEAKSFCESVLSHITDQDREYVSHFLLLDLEFAAAQAGLGLTSEATARVDRLIERFRSTGHPLALGMMHETRARISWGAGNVEEYERSLKEVERWYGSTGTPFLIAKSRRLAALRPAPAPKQPSAQVVLAAQDDVSTSKTLTASGRLE